MGQRLPTNFIPNADTQLASAAEAPRAVERIIRAIRTEEGAGFIVNRPFPQHGVLQIDPFLLLDQMGPVELGPGEAKGAPDHPHRGFETVSYILEGALEHQDSQGNRGKLGPGDVQWMTAGDGVVHSEMPARGFADQGGRLHGFQLWVNLPQRDKRMRPRYQEVPAARIPLGRSADGKVAVKVIAGESLGQRAVIDTRTPIFYLHATLQPGGVLSQPVPAGFNAFAYVITGQGLFGSNERAAGPGELALFAQGGDALVRNDASSTAPLEVLLIGGQPLGEPVARYGPFVMNTREEIFEAIEDFQAGRMGRIAPQPG